MHVCLGVQQPPSNVTQMPPIPSHFGASPAPTAIVGVLLQFPSAAALQVVSELWQHGSYASRSVAVLRSEPGFWASLTSLLSYAPQGGKLSQLSDASYSQEASAWVAGQAAVSRAVAEVHALEIIAAECVLWRTNGAMAAGKPPDACAGRGSGPLYASVPVYGALRADPQPFSAPGTELFLTKVLLLHVTCMQACPQSCRRG
jgi:hypothetical protein